MASALPAGFEPIDFDAFHRYELPKRLARGNGRMAAAYLQRAGSLAFRLPDGEAYTYVPGSDGVEILPGDARAQTVIEIEHSDWQGVVHELETAPSLLYGKRVKCSRGNGMAFVRWDPGLRTLYHGRPLYDPERVELARRDGTALDPAQTFDLADDDAEMAHFLRTTGYLRVKSVFTPDEVAEFVRCAQVARDEAREGDKESWWGKNDRGETVLCRVTNAGRLPAIGGLYEDARVLRLTGLADVDLVPRGGGGNMEQASVLWKNPHMKEGLSDLPWHRDCGMGGHAVMCPILIVTITVTEATTAAGALRMLPGSWDKAFPYVDASHETAPAGVVVTGEAGDLSLHYSDTMHAAPPPESDEGPFRISILLGFAQPEARSHRGKGKYNDVLLYREDGQIEHLDKVIERGE